LFILRDARAAASTQDFDNVSQVIPSAGSGKTQAAFRGGFLGRRRAQVQPRRMPAVATQANVCATKGL
jgi:hypothetical protein